MLCDQFFGFFTSFNCSSSACLTKTKQRNRKKVKETIEKEKNKENKTKKDTAKKREKTTKKKIRQQTVPTRTNRWGILPESWKDYSSTDWLTECVCGSKLNIFWKKIIDYEEKTSIFVLSEKLHYDPKVLKRLFGKPNERASALTETNYRLQP